MKWLFQLREFEQSLLPHQREISDGCSILQRAVVEHNLIAVNKMFINIHFVQLAELLDTNVVQVIHKCFSTSFYQFTMKITSYENVLDIEPANIH